MNPTIGKILPCLILVFSAITVGYSQNCIYPSPNIYVQNDNCSLTADLCLDIPFGSRNDYEVYVDGVLYSGTYTPCNYDTLSFYNILTLKTYLDGAVDPDMVVDSVRINDVLHSFSFTSLQSLADSIDALDPTSTWTLSGTEETLDHEHNSSSYTDIFFKDITTDATFSARFQKNSTPQGLMIELSNGFHELVLNEIANA